MSAERDPPLMRQVVEALEACGGRQFGMCMGCGGRISNCDKNPVWGAETCPGYLARRALAAIRERRPRAEDDVARLLILNGKGWHDADGPVVVDGIDAEDGAGYPVKYHWEAGGAGADSIKGFIGNNYLPVGEVCRVIAELLFGEVGSPAKKETSHAK